VILPGAVYVTESKLRRSTGTHYTPRFLAEEVVEGAPEPLIYSVGPLQTADRSQHCLYGGSKPAAGEGRCSEVVLMPPGAAALVVVAGARGRSKPVG
jgi:hypothetical protein